MPVCARLGRAPESAVFVLLSVVIPVYNERATIEAVIAAVREQPYDLDIVIVDDGSTDGTREWLAELDVPNVRTILHEHNRGKGAAVRTGFAHVKGDITLIQDADLECSPADFPVLLEPILEGHADVVFGSRFVGSRMRRVGSFRHAFANRMLTSLSNLMTNLNLTDMEVGYKVFKTEVLRQLDLRCDRFGIEPELTAKVARLDCRIYEVPIAYTGRNFNEGKKIGWRDGFAALYFIFRYGLGFE